MDKIKTECSVSKVKFMELDLNDLNSVKNFAKKFNKKYEKCDLLINNAGINTRHRHETV